jgi:glycerol-3-phosphate acyltransferase PlsY
MTVVALLLAILPFYLLGAFPTGVLVAKLHGIDITSQGSGNVGATNVARVVGKQAGVLTLVGDVAKGAIGAAIAQLCFGDTWAAAAASAAVVV